MSPRPFKIWSRDRVTKKSVTASNLEELLLKAKEKLSLPSNDKVRLVLEEDGTEVDDDDYLTYLPNNVTLQAIVTGEEWLPIGKVVKATDDLDGTSTGGECDRRSTLVKTLRTDLTRIVTFSNDDLQLIANMDPETLAHDLHDSREHAQCIQATCVGHLDSHDRTNEAIALLDLYHKAQTAEASGDGVSVTKRRRVP